ncbi:hypothetical protein BJY00DRAFT_280308 [Aspergillus carlsbadensis]|nr:hypothetical protein BJY00DRAFT_280308 [Aspergillus carlsbadensis]
MLPLKAMYRMYGRIAVIIAILLLSLLYLLPPLPSSQRPTIHTNNNKHPTHNAPLPIPTHPYTPQIIETDLIFPQHNKTYRPLASFPLIFGFQNPRASWPLHTALMVFIKYEKDNGPEDGFAFPPPRRPAEGGSEQLGPDEQWFLFTNTSYPPLSAEAAGAVDSYIHVEFPRSLRNWPAGRYDILWIYGFARTCRADGSLQEDGEFFRPRNSGGGEISFVISDEEGAEGIEDVLLGGSGTRRKGKRKGWSGCDRVAATSEDGEDHFALAWRVDDFAVLDLERDPYQDKEGNSMYPFCPVLNGTELRDMPVARPCDLVLDEGVVDDILARVNGSIGIEDGLVRDREDEEQGRLDLA